jgi:hypothetical protein
MCRGIRVWIGPFFTALMGVILGCLCNLFIETKLPNYLKVLYPTVL